MIQNPRATRRMSLMRHTLSAKAARLLLSLKEIELPPNPRICGTIVKSHISKSRLQNNWHLPFCIFHLLFNSAWIGNELHGPFFEIAGVVKRSWTDSKWVKPLTKVYLECSVLIWGTWTPGKSSSYQRNAPGFIVRWTLDRWVRQMNSTSLQV